MWPVLVTCGLCLWPVGVGVPVCVGCGCPWVWLGVGACVRADRCVAVYLCICVWVCWCASVCVCWAGERVGGVGLLQNGVLTVSILVFSNVACVREAGETIRGDPNNSWLREVPPYLLRNAPGIELGQMADAVR